MEFLTPCLNNAHLVRKWMSPLKVYSPKWRTIWSIANPLQYSSVQSLRCVRLFVIPWITACQASLPLPTRGVNLNSCPSSWWYNTAISPSVNPFSSCPKSLPASGSFPMSQLLHEVVSLTLEDPFFKCMYSMYEPVKCMYEPVNFLKTLFVYQPSLNNYFPW